MNVLTNLKTFSSFGGVIRTLSTLITVLKVLSGVFLAVQVVMVLLESKSRPLNELIKFA